MKIINKIGIKKEYDCQCNFCKKHYCILEFYNSNRFPDNFEIKSRCMHYKCKINNINKTK